MMPGPPGPLGSGKIYPPNQPMVFNPSNPNAPPIYPCGGCHKEVSACPQSFHDINLQRQSISFEQICC